MLLQRDKRTFDMLDPARCTHTPTPLHADVIREGVWTTEHIFKQCEQNVEDHCFFLLLLLLLLVENGV